LVCIRETGLSVSEITFDDLDVYSDIVLKRPESVFTNLLCFPSEAFYQDAKSRLAG